MILRLYLAVVLLLLSGCSFSSSSYIRGELSNKGPYVLSDNNPYLAPNVLLADVMSSSGQVKGFVEHRGTPDALEVRKSSFGPYKYYFFYLDKNEAYLLQKGFSTWIILGPQRIPGEILSDLESGESGSRSKALLFSEDDTVDPKVEDDFTGFTNDRAPEPRSASQRGRSAHIRISSNGDLIHRVTFPGETVRILSAWYTGSIENVGRLSRINDIDNPDILYIEEEIRIPSYMVRQSEPLPEEAHQKYIHEMSSPVATQRSSDSPPVPRRRRRNR